MAKARKPKKNMFILDIETSHTNWEELNRLEGKFSIRGIFEASKEGAYGTSAFSTAFVNNQILQMHIEESKAYRKFSADGSKVYKKGSGYTKLFLDKNHILPYRDIVKNVEFPIFLDKFSNDIAADALKYATLTEEQQLRRLFQAVQGKSIKAGGPIQLAGWNVKYDIASLKASAARYSSLNKYVEFFDKAYATNKIQFVSLEDELFKQVWTHASQNPDLMRHLTDKARARTFDLTLELKSSEDLKNVPGWKASKIARMLGLGEELHRAAADVALERMIYEAVITNGLTLEHIKAMYGAWRTEASSIKEVTEVIGDIRPLNGFALLAGAAAAIAAGLAFSTRSSRQTTIVGLSDNGKAKDSRHKHTSFGSGWHGLGEDNSSLNYKALGAAGFAAAGYSYFRKVIVPGKGPFSVDKLHSFVSTLEDYSPFKIGRTFGISQYISSYTTPSKLHVGYSELVGQGGKYTELGEHFDRLFTGSNVDLRSQKGLNFIRTDYGPYMELEGYGGDVRARFTKRGSLSSSSYRYNKPLENVPVTFLKESTPWETITKNFGRLRHSQEPTGYKGAISVGEEVEGVFQPYLVNIKSRGKLFNFAETANRTALSQAERVQRLLSDIGLGLKEGTWNKAFHVPIIGEGGLVNQLLTKRFAPAALLVGLALPYIDYKTGHSLSGIALDTFQRFRLAHASLTDHFLRGVTDKYEQIVPGPQYGPLALPVSGAFVGGVLQYSNVLRTRYTKGEKAAELLRSGSKFFSAPGQKSILGILNRENKGAVGVAIGLALMLPFIPGMIGSRKTKEELQRTYSGEDPVEIKAGRWWDMGTTALEGGRVKEYRPHWSVLWRAQAEKKALYGSEKEYWRHNPILHPLRWLRDPYFLEEKHYEDRPYPETSPAFTNVPLVGPLLASTIGQIVKPIRKMHPEWDTTDYTLGSTRLEPRGPKALPAAEPTSEFSLGDTAQRSIKAATEFVGLPGFIGRSLWNKTFPGYGSMGENVKFQGSRQMTNYSRKYYELELGAVSGVSPDFELFGYSEPFRRFVQNEGKLLQANSIKNKMPSWLPGEDYFINFRTGDPYVKISTGFARLPGEGYAALHPELEGVSPEDYPDMEKLRILGDVAPYSREFAIFKGKVRKDIRGDTESLAEYESIMARANKMRKSVIRTEEQRFSKDVEETTGTVKALGSAGVELNEYPGRIFRMSGVSTTAADMSAVVLSQYNDMTKEDAAKEIDVRRAELDKFLSDTFTAGTKVTATFQKGALDKETNIRSVLEIDGLNINKAIVGEGYGTYDKASAGAEWQAMFNPAERLLGRYAEEASFAEEAPWWNPLRWLPTPYHTKLWQERSALAQYVDQETVGTRMRRWDKPIKDFLAPYYHGLLHRVSGEVFIPEATVEKRNLNTMVDMLDYLRDLNLASTDSESRGRYTSKASRTAIGANLTGSTTFLGSTLPDRDTRYFKEFVNSTDDEERQKILDVVPDEMARALEAQWAGKEAQIAESEGKETNIQFSGGRLVNKEGLDRFKKATTKLDYGDYERSLEISDFFAKTGLSVPESDSALWDPNIDYEDVKLKIIEMEGRDYHDFNIFDDRASLLWRKPYVDGAVQELTSGNDRSEEQIRRQVERLMLAAKNPNANPFTSGHPSQDSRGSATINVNVDQTEELLKDMRRNPENYD